VRDESSARVAVADLLLETDTGFRLNIPAFTLSAGEIIALVGPNGSGKTTLIEILLGLRRVKRGKIAVLDASLSELEAHPRRRRRIGSQLQKSNYGSHLRVAEILRLHRALYDRVNPELEERLGIRELRAKPYTKLSGGQRQRVDLFVAMAHEPDLLFLDEPGTGLDRHYLDALGALLRGLASSQRRASVLMASHKPDEIALADKIVLLADGSISDVLDLPAGLERRLGSKRFELEFASADQAKAAEGELSSDPSAAVVLRDGARVILFARDDLNDRLVQQYGGSLISYSYAGVGIGDLLAVTSRDDSACSA
jgi:ABC-2 type transport system ATP-binding protein